jgi:hypothetical protein
VSRNIASNTLAELAKDQFIFAHLVKVVLSNTSTIYLTDSFHNLTHDSQTYQASGSLLSMTAIKESAILQVGRVNITLSGVDSTIIAAASTESFINNDVVVHRAIINPNTGAYIDTPRQIFDGTISNYSISESQTSSSVTIVVSSNWANFQQINGRVTNSDSQNNTYRYGTSTTFSNDLGFQYASAAITDIKWGQV